MVDNSLALGIKTPEIGVFNPLQAMLVASQLRNAETQNSLAQVQLQTAPALAAAHLRTAETQNSLGQLQVDERTQASNALADYRKRIAENDPSADTALAGQPDLMTKVIQARGLMKEDQRKTLDDNLLRNAQGAQRVLSLPVDQRAGAWTEELETALKEKRINPLQYERMKSMPPDEKLLAPIVKAGLSIENQISLEQKEKDREAGREFSQGMSTLFGGGAAKPAAPAGATPSYFTTLKTAESSNNPAATPPVDPKTGKPSSTAAGLFQITKGTWDGIATKYPDLGLTPEARTGTDEASIALQEKAAKALTAENAGALVKSEIAPTDRNLYMAHFLGGDGAVKFLNGMKENPNAPAINFASKEAVEANKSVFYDKDGMPKTALGVYNSLTNKFAGSNTVVSGVANGAPGDANATIAGIPAQALIPFLARSASLPGLPKESREVATELLKTVLSESKPTDAQKEYLQYVKQEIGAGRTPKSLFDYKVALKEGGEEQTELQKGLEKGLAKTFNDMAEAGVAAGDKKAIIGRLGSLLEQSGTGAGITFVNWVRENTGIKLNPKADVAEAANAMVAQLTPQMRVPGSGATSDFEMKTFGKSIPNLMSTPDGKRIMVETLGGIYEAQQQRADIATRVQIGELKPKEAIAEIKKLPDPFQSFKSWQGGKQGTAGVQAPSMPTFSEPAAVKFAIQEGHLKKGDQFRTQDGRVGTVDDTWLGAQ